MIAIRQILNRLDWRLTQTAISFKVLLKVLLKALLKVLLVLTKMLLKTPILLHSDTLRYPAEDCLSVAIFRILIPIIRPRHDRLSCSVTVAAG